jgi:hypothetical protein
MVDPVTPGRPADPVVSGRVSAAPPPPPRRPEEPPIAILVDDDGTVAQTDVSDAAEFVTDEWETKAAECDECLSGSRRLMEWEVGLITASPADLRALAAAQPHDPGFAPFVRRLCLENGWPFRRWADFSEMDTWLAGVIEAWRADPATPAMPRPAERVSLCGPEAWGEGPWDPPGGASA